MSNPTDKAFKPRRPGGPDYHKPGCGCPACSARRRKKEALPIRTGDGGDALVAPTPEALALKTSAEDSQKVAEDGIITDLPPIVTTKRSNRASIAQWAQWRAIEPGISNKEIAKRLGISPTSLRTLIYRASKEGWLQFNDPVASLQYQLMPKVVRNLDYYLEEGDKQVTIEVAKGTLFKQYLQEEGLAPHEANNIIAIKIETAPGGTPQRGTIVGVPRTMATIEAEVLKSSSPDDEDE